MDELPLPLDQTILLLVVFAGPFLGIGALAQFMLLRRAQVRGLATIGILILAALLTLLFALIIVRFIAIRWSNMEGDILAIPSLLAAMVVTAGVALLFRRRPAV